MFALGIAVFKQLDVAGVLLSGTTPDVGRMPNTALDFIPARIICEKETEPSDFPAVFPINMIGMDGRSYVKKPYFARHHNFSRPRSWKKSNFHNYEYCH